MLITHNSIPNNYLSQLKKIDNLSIEQDSVNKNPAFIILYNVEPDYVRNRLSIMDPDDDIVRKHSIIIIAQNELTNKLMNEYYSAGATLVCDYAITPLKLKDIIINISIGETYNSLVRDDRTDSIYDITGNTQFNSAKNIIRVNGEEKELNNKEKEILQILLDNKGEYISKNKLLTTLWGNVEKSASRSFDVYINRLRHILEKDNEIKLRKIRNIGYTIIKGEEENKKIKNKY